MLTGFYKIALFLSTVVLASSLKCGQPMMTDKLQTGIKELEWETFILGEMKIQYTASITKFQIQNTGTFQILASIYQIENFSVQKELDYEINGMLDITFTRIVIRVSRNTNTKWSKIKISYLASQNLQFLAGSAFTYPQLGENSAEVLLNQTRFAQNTEYSAFGLISGIKSAGSQFFVSVINSEINPETGKLTVNFNYEGTRPQQVRFNYFVYESVHDQFAYSTFNIGGTYEIHGLTSLSQSGNSIKSFALCRKSFESFCPENEIIYQGECICIDESRRDPLNFNKCGGECTSGIFDEKGQCIICQKNQIFIQAQQICQCKVGFERYLGNCVTKCLINEERNIHGMCQCASGFYYKQGQCAVKPNCPASALFDIKLEKCICIHTGSLIVDGKCEQCGDGRKTQDEQCDDNNFKNGDGCNSLCKVEQRWQCKEDNLNSTSLCSKIKLTLVKTESFTFPNRIQIYYVFSDFPLCLRQLTDPTQVASQLMKIQISNNYQFASADLHYDAFIQKYIADFIFTAARQGDFLDYEISVNENFGNAIIQSCLSELDQNHIIEDRVIFRAVPNS